MLGIQFILIVFIIMVVIILVRKNFVEFTPLEGESSAGSKEATEAQIEATLWLKTLARRKAELPALFLMGMGGINLIMGAVLCGRTLQMAFKPIEEFEQEYQEAREITARLFPEADRLLNEKPWDGPTALRHTILVNLGASVALLAGSWLMGLGGWRMRHLRSFPLAMTGAIFSAIPCLSCAGCFGLGQFVAFWAVMVLLDPMVRSAFRAANHLQSRQDDHFC